MKIGFEGLKPQRLMGQKHEPRRLQRDTMEGDCYDTLRDEDEEVEEPEQQR